MSAPNGSGRRILVAACGMTPQVITETLYALRVAAPDPYRVNEIRIITTAVGRKQAELSLLRNGVFECFCREYGFDDIRFDDSHIEVIRDERGAELTDIRTPEHNRCAADGITDLIRRLTHEPDTSLHVSLAGGRKTMGYYIGYALSLYGRAQDRLSHVLVSEGFETNFNFFYPTRESQVISAGDNRYLDAKEAVVTLAEIPFVRLRDSLPERLLAERSSFSEAVRWSNLDNELVRLEIDVRARTVRASGMSLELPASLFAFYLAFARAALDGEDGFEVRESCLPLTRAIAEELARCHGETPREGMSFEDLFELLEDAGVDDRVVNALKREDAEAKPVRLLGIGKAYAEPKVSDLGRLLEQALGKRLADVYRVHLRGRIGKGSSAVSHYGVSLEPDQITVKD